MKVNQQQGLLNEETVTSALVGCLLGDSSFEDTFINVLHSIKHEDYVMLKYREFSRFFNVGKLGVSNNWGSNPDESLRKALRFRILRDLSKTRYDLDYFYELMYDRVNRKRRIPIEHLEEILTPIALFFWYLDDGHFIVRPPKGKHRNFRRRLAITLKGFDDESILTVVSFLEEKYGLNINIERNKENKILRFYMSSQLSIFKFLNIFDEFKDYFPESLRYKFEPQFTNAELLKIKDNVQRLSKA